MKRVEHLLDPFHFDIGQYYKPWYSSHGPLYWRKVMFSKRWIIVGVSVLLAFVLHRPDDPLTMIIANCLSVLGILVIGSDDAAEFYRTQKSNAQYKNNASGVLPFKDARVWGFSASLVVSSNIVFWVLSLREGMTEFVMIMCFGVALVLFTFCFEYCIKLLAKFFVKSKTMVSSPQSHGFRKKV